MNIYGQVGWRAAAAVNPSSGVDADAQAFITAATITNSTQQSAINTLVTDLKAANIWTKMKALYPFVGGTAAQHRFNLKDPRTVNAAFYLTFNGGGTHSSTGYTTNGSTSYADTFLSPSATLSLNSTHISGYLRNNNSSNGPILSTEDASTYNNGLYIWPKQDISNSYSVRINDNTSEQGTPINTDIRGLHIATRTASNVKKYIVNTTQRFNVSHTTTSLNSSSIYIAKSRNNSNYFANEIAFTSIGDGLTDAEALAFYNAVQAYQTTLGRAV